MASLTMDDENTVSPAVQLQLDEISQLYLDDFFALASTKLEGLLKSYVSPPKPAPAPAPPPPKNTTETTDNAVVVQETNEPTEPMPPTNNISTSTSPSSSTTVPEPIAPSDPSTPASPTQLPPSFTTDPHSPISRTHRITQELKQVCKDFESAEGWTFKSWKSDNDQCLYRLEEDGTHSFRVEGFVDAPLFNLLALVYEFDLFPLWFPLLKTAEEIAVPSRFSKFARIVAWAPWPMADRECVLRGYGDVYDGDSVAIFAKDAVPADLINTPCEGQTELPKEGLGGTCRINVNRCGFHFIPVVDEKSLQRKEGKEGNSDGGGGPGKTPPTSTSNDGGESKTQKTTTSTASTKKNKDIGAGGRVLCRVFFNIDLKIALLPDFLLNLIIGKFCWVILTLVRKYAHPNKMIGSEYEKRIAGNSEVYNEMRRRLEESLTSENIHNNVIKYCNERQQEVLKSLKPVHL